MKRRIMIIEDDPSISRVVRDGLEYNGFAVECVTEGNKALAAIRSFAPDLILLDLMLPGLDGYEICRCVAEGPTPTPMIILSARSQCSDKVKALHIGADDYVTKPFLFDELLARIDALLRRTNPVPKKFALGDVQIDLTQLIALKAGQRLDLTHREFELLRFLLIHRDNVVTREQLLRSVWGYDEVPMTRTVDHFIARLRAKIEDDPHHPRYLHTVYGDGYKLTPKD
jgi:DNA-binding response OmpR family regulator